MKEEQRVSDGLYAAVLMGGKEQERLQTALEDAQGKLGVVEEHIMALRPFVAFAVHIDPKSPDDAELLPDLSIAHFRNAKASYEALVRILHPKGGKKQQS